MEDKAYSIGETTKDVPYLTVEGIQARNERVIHRLIRIIIFLIVGLILNNAMWIYFYNQYEYSDTTTTETTTEYSQDGTGNNIIGNNNEVSHEPENPNNTNSNPNPNTDTP